MIEGEILSVTSRVHLRKFVSVDHNVKVKELGQIVEEDFKVLINYVKAELRM